MSRKCLSPPQCGWLSTVTNLCTLIFCLVSSDRLVWGQHVPTSRVTVAQADNTAIDDPTEDPDDILSLANESRWKP